MIVSFHTDATVTLQNAGAFVGRTIEHAGAARVVESVAIDRDAVRFVFGAGDGQRRASLAVKVGDVVSLPLGEEDEGAILDLIDEVLKKANEAERLDIIHATRA